jgi:hypothetical protein
MLRPSAGSVFDLERQAAVLRLVAERALDGADQAAEVDLLGVDRHGARLDLRQVEDVGDQVQEVGARGVDRARELDLLVGEVALGIVAELLAEDQDAVQRRAQLVRHVGEELGLVLRRERELGGLALDLDVAARRAAGPSARAARSTAGGPSGGSGARSRAAATA